MKQLRTIESKVVVGANFLDRGMDLLDVRCVRRDPLNNQLPFGVGEWPGSPVEHAFYMEFRSVLEVVHRGGKEKQHWA